MQPDAEPSSMPHFHSPTYYGERVLTRSIFRSTNYIRLTPSISVHPLHDPDLHDEDILLIPPPLLAGRDREPDRQLPARTVQTMFMIIGLMDDVDSFFRRMAKRRD